MMTDCIEQQEILNILIDSGLYDEDTVLNWFINMSSDEIIRNLCEELKKYEKKGNYL